MSISTKRLADVIKRIQEQTTFARMVKADVFAKDADFDAEAVVHNLLVESLSKQQRAVYLFVCDRAPGMPTTSTDVAKRFGISIQAASTILKDLHEYGLINREEFTSTEGRFYEYN